MKIIYKARDIVEAHIVSGLLNSNGIESHVSGHYLQGGVGDLAVSDFANVHIADEDVLSAKAIIAEYESEQDIPRKNIKFEKATLTSRVILAIFVFSLIIFISYVVTL